MRRWSDEVRFDASKGELVEIVDYLRIARRRLRILIAVPLLAGLITAAAVMLAPRMYTATAVVAAPAAVGGAPTNQYTGSQAVTQFVGAFQGAADSPAVARRVAEKTGEKLRELDQNLTVLPVGTSAIMRVTYRSADRGIVDDVANVAATETLRYLFGSQAELAKRELDLARADLDAINKQMQGIFKDAGTVDPVTLYTQKLQEISTLRVRQSEFRALGQLSAAASIESTISTRRKELSELAPRVEEYKKLNAQADATKAAMVAVRTNLSQAQAQAAAADPTRVISLSGTRAEDRLPMLLQKIGPAIGAGLFLAVELVVILELLARRRRAAAIEEEPAKEEESGLLVPAPSPMRM
jgi:capsular polysaccharide biosynthesis protein